MINTLDELAQMYHKMSIQASEQNSTLFSELYAEFMKYTKHLEHILKSDG